MKYLAVFVPLCALILSTACTQSPQKLIATADKYHQNKKYKEASILYQKAISKDKTNAEAYYREGLNQLDLGQPIEAVRFLRRAVDLKPDNTDAESKLAEIYLAAYARDPKRNKTLLPDIRDLDSKILQRNPDSFDGIRLQALIDLTDNKTDDALKGFARANQLKPYSRDLIGWYAQTLDAAGQPDQAIALIKEMLAHDKSWGPGYDFLFLHYSRAKDRAKAEAVLWDRLQSDPKSIVGISNLASYLAATNRKDQAEQVMSRVLKDKTAFPNGRQLMGDFYARVNKYDDALKQYQAGVTEDPKNALRYRERIVTIYQLTGQHEKAVQLAKQLAEKNPKDNSATELYAAVLLQSGNATDLKNSLAELKTLIGRSPESPILHLNLARAYFETGDMDKALAEANETVRLNRNLTAAHIVAARIYEDRGDHAKALEMTDPVVAVQPQNPDAGLIRARAHIGLGETDRAQSELESLVQQNPQMNDARLNLAALYLAKKDFQKAYEMYQAVQNSKPPDVRGFIGLQNVKVATGKSDDAVKAMRDLVQKNPNVIPFRYELANFETADAAQSLKTDPSHSQELIQQAMDDYKQILKTTTNSADVWLRLGVLQREQKQYDAALASFDQAARANPKRPDALLNEGMLQEAMGKTKDAVDTYNKVLGVDPNNALALNNVAYLNADSGKNLDQAMTFAERAKKAMPNSPDISDTLGYVYYQKNLNTEALQIFRQLVQDNPKNSTFHFHLAMALLKQGDKQGAREEAQKALEDAQPTQQGKIRSFVSQIG